MLPNTIPEDRIIELEKVQRASFATISDLEAHKLRKAEKRKLQLEWLQVFEVTMSPRLASARSGVSHGTYHGWRKDPEFCKLFNRTLENVKEELYGAALGRAIGYRPFDDDGNPAFDADGKPIYTGGSDKLMASFLGLNATENKVDLAVNIEIVSRKKDEMVISDLV